MTAKSDNRRGLTLLEVIFALAIFVGSSLVLSQLVRHGTDAIERARLETTAALLAESKMSEITSGVTSMVDDGAPFVDRPQWRWKVLTSDGSLPGLKRVQVIVFPAADGPLAKFSDSFRFTLKRWIYLGNQDRSSESRSVDLTSEVAR